MVQYQATYRLTVTTYDDVVTVAYPITCKLNATRGVFTESQKATIQLYNLAPATRNIIFQDMYTNMINPLNWKFVDIEAGYNGNLSRVFFGRIIQAYSYKAGGQTDIITEIQASAMDVFDNSASYTFAAGTTFKDALKTMASSMPNVIMGSIGALDGSFKTPTTFDGNAMSEINKLTGGHSFVDNGVLNTLMDNEALDVPVPVITNNTLLYETPRRRDANIEIKTRFMPDIVIGQLVEVESGVLSQFSGQFKLVGLTHDCLFSPTQAGNRTTQMTLWVGPLLPNADNAITGKTQTQVFSKVKGEEIQPVSLEQPASVQGVYNYIQQNNGAIPNTKITKNISWREMLGHNNTNEQRKSEITINVLSNVYTIASTLQRFIDTFYSGRSVTITSGWRSSANNRSCGGHPKSKHLYGLAVDFVVNGVDSYDTIRRLQQSWNGYVQQYPSRNFCHAQLNTGQGRVNDV